MSEDDKIDRHLRDRLKDQEHPVSDRVWANIKSSLPPEESNHAGWGWKNWLTTSAIVATTMLLIYYWNSSQGNSDTVVSSGNTSAHTTQISPAVSAANERSKLPETVTPEKDTAAIAMSSPSPAATTSSSIVENTSNNSSIAPQKSSVVNPKINKNTSEKNSNEVSGNNPADKYSIAYAYTFQHPGYTNPLAQNNSSPVVKSDAAPVVSENTNTNTTSNVPNEMNTSNKEIDANELQTTNNTPSVNTVSENTSNVPESVSSSQPTVHNNTTSEVTPDVTANPDSPVAMNNTPTPSVSKNDQEPVAKEDKNKEQEEKQEEKNIKEKKDKKDKDQEKEKSILPKPVFSADAYIMPAYTGLITSSNTQDPSLRNQIDHKNAHDRTWVTWSYGGRLNYHMTDAIELSAGLHYQKIEERISATRSLNTFDKGISAQSRYSMLVIPLGAAYNFNAGRLRVRMGASCNLQYTLTSETYFYNETKKDLDLYNYDAEGMNLALQVSGGIVYPITPRFNVLVEPSLQYNLDDLNHSTMFFKEKPYLIGLKTGVRMIF